MTRYESLFSSLQSRGEGAFVPFIMLGDPDTETSFSIIRTIVEAGADALELGVPFSDPVADGPTIQKSHLRALEGGSTIDRALELVRRVRQEWEDLPIGMLIYGNVPFTRGLERFYREFADAGVDSILLPDVPVREGGPFIAAAKAAEVDPIFIAPARASERTLKGVAANSQGYIYAISRDGVTGTEKESETTGLAEVVDNVKRFGGAPILLGFGISRPEHVQEAIAAGSAGAITGSAITKIIDKHIEAPSEGGASYVADFTDLEAELTEYVSQMKEATRS